MQLLLLKGKEGMPVSQVSRMVYNLHNNLFDHRLNYYELHRTIRMYLSVSYTHLRAHET